MIPYQYGNALSRPSTSLSLCLAIDRKNLSNALQNDVTPYKWATIPPMLQVKQQQELIKFIILSPLLGDVPPQNQESLATKQDSTVDKMQLFGSVTKVSENVLISLIKAMSKNPEINLDFAFVCKRIGLELAFKTQLKL